MNFTSEEQGFLRKHGLKVTDFYVTSGQSTAQIYASAKKENKKFIVHSPCLKGHRLKTRRGHCIQCNPARIAFSTRASSTADVYIAVSVSKDLVKVGFAKDVFVREGVAKSIKYGGIADWKVIFAMNCDDAGRVELQTHSFLKNHQVQAVYTKDGTQQAAREMFRCKPDVALNAILRAVEGLRIVPKSLWKDRAFKW